MQLIIAEKPSVAHLIAKAIGASHRKDGYLECSGYAVSWCFGHLVEMKQPDAYGDRYAKWRYENLPIIPDRFEYDVPESKAAQFNVLKKLMAREDVGAIVCATDAGREGELIFRLVYEHCGCKKQVKRLWISSMEDAAIKAGLAMMKDGSEYDRLYRAALCRAKADWLVGINATRLFSVLYDETLNIGRVMTPTLALLVRRKEAIASFKSKPHYTPQIDCGTFTAQAKRTEDKNVAEKIAQDSDGKVASVTKAERYEKSETPPALYDITSLQRDANRLLGFTAQQTLDYLQALYEKKLATYPRTDSRHLTEDMEDSTRKLAVALFDAASFTQGIEDYSPDFSRVIDGAKVSDHHAILPTIEVAGIDLSALPKGERDVLSLIIARLLVATAEMHTYEAVTVTLSCGGTDFTANGRTVLSDGWKRIDTAWRATLKDAKADDIDTNDSKAASLPQIAEDDVFEHVAATVREGKTTPPKHYTDDTLLSAMETAGACDTPKDAERKGLGTPATRAAIIEKLVTVGFAERRKKQLLPTKKGDNLIAVLPDMLTSPTLTAEWETRLLEMERGNIEEDVFMDGICDLVRMLVQRHDKPDPAFVHLLGGKAAGSGGEVIGVCPRCGGAIREHQKGFFCENNACTFALWKDNKFFAYKKKELTKAVAITLLKDGRVKMKGLYSEKTGKTYDATIVMDDSGGKYVNFKMEFEKGERKNG
jgi:DNA topoisomerase-3